MYQVCAVAQGQAHIASPARLHSGSNIVSDWDLFRSKSTDPPIPERVYLKIWPWKSKSNVMGIVKG